MAIDAMDEDALLQQALALSMQVRRLALLMLSSLSPARCCPLLIA